MLIILAGHAHFSWNQFKFKVRHWELCFRVFPHTWNVPKTLLMANMLNWYFIVVQIYSSLFKIYFPLSSSLVEDIFNMQWWPRRLMFGFFVHEWIPLYMYHLSLSKSFKTLSFEDPVFTPRYTSISPKSANVFFSLGWFLLMGNGIARAWPGRHLSNGQPSWSPADAVFPDILNLLTGRWVTGPAF